MSDQLAKSIALNLKRLRDARQVSQQRLSDLSGVPRPTLANLESGAANPTLSLMLRVSEALEVPLEELLRQPVPSIAHYKGRALVARRRAGANLQRLVEPNSSACFERVELRVGGRWSVKPENPGGRHHLYCESGQVLVTAAGESCPLAAGEMAVLGTEVGFTATNAAKQRALVFRVVAPGLRHT